MKVLVLNNDSSILHIIEDYLSCVSLEKVYFTNNFYECQEIIRCEDIDIIMIDFTFSETFDNKMLGEICKISNNSGLYSLIITDKCDAENIEKYLQFGLNDFILKPLDKSVFIAKMRFVMIQKRRIKELEFQLLHKQKLASIGELTAGVSHEVNNSITFVGGNLDVLTRYVKQLKLIMMEYRTFLKKYEKNDEINVANSKNENCQLKDNDEIPTNHTISEKHQPSSNDALNAIQFTKDLKNLLSLEDKYKIDYIINELDAVLQDSRTGISSITKFVSNLRNYARSNNNDKKEAYILNDIVSKCVLIVDGEAKPNIDIEVVFSQLPLCLFNRGQISQVIVNIFLNAIQAIKSHNNIFRGKIKVTTFEDDQYVVCSINDNGPGIPDDIIPNIFEAFYTTKKIGVGTGLGLSIAYDIITRKHKGELTVTTLIGEGTTFFVKLPK